LITLNRPKALNALNDQLMHEINDCLKKIDADDQHSAIVITGSGKAFAGKLTRLTE
jgi:enoyl-CoA hydratase/carnithine racemase